MRVKSSFMSVMYLYGIFSRSRKVFWNRSLSLTRASRMILSGWALCIIRWAGETHISTSRCRQGAVRDFHIPAF